MAETGLPDFNEIWDFNHPAETAVRFREILPQARESGDVGYTIELLTQIARTQSLQDNFDEAHAILDEAEALLNDDLAIPQMRYLLERGRAYNSAGDQDTAVSLFKEAYELGLTLGQAADFYTVDAAHMLGIAVPSNEAQLAWNLLALDLARSSKNERAQGWRGSLLNNIGWTYFDREEFQTALTLFEEAQLWREEYNPDQPELIRIAKWCVARTLRALDRVEEALMIQEALLAEREAIGEDGGGFTFEELAECYWELGEVERAKPYFALAYNQLSKPGWFARNHPERLQRLKRLGEVED